MLTENEIIDILATNLGQLRNGVNKNDISTLSLENLKGMNTLILKCDMLVESTDVPKEMQKWQIARKSISACVSDLSSKGIDPKIALISLGIPKKYSKFEIEDLARGFKMASREFDVKIIGGDTNESKELIIDCCLIGFSEHREVDLPGRGGAKVGDSVVVSGEFGYTSAGLQILMNNAKAHSHLKLKAVSSVTEPKPAQKFGTCLANYFSASIDSSDGLGISLYEIAKQSHVDIIIDNIPAAKGIHEFAKKNLLDQKQLIFCGGEEYEIIATMSPPNLVKARAIARRAKLKLHVVGKVVKGHGKVKLRDGKAPRESLLEENGYVHFSSNKTLAKYDLL